MSWGPVSSLFMYFMTCALVMQNIIALLLTRCTNKGDDLKLRLGLEKDLMLFSFYTLPCFRWDSILTWNPMRLDLAPILTGFDNGSLVYIHSCWLFYPLYFVLSHYRNKQHSAPWENWVEESWRSWDLPWSGLNSHHHCITAVRKVEKKHKYIIIP